MGERVNKNTPLYTREEDGTISTWYVDEQYGNEFSVASRRNARLRDYHKYYGLSDIGHTIFLAKDCEVYYG